MWEYGTAKTIETIWTRNVHIPVKDIATMEVRPLHRNECKLARLYRVQFHTYFITVLSP